MHNEYQAFAQNVFAVCQIFQLRMGLLYHLTMTTQSLIALYSTPGNTRLDTSTLQVGTTAATIIPLVCIASLVVTLSRLFLPAITGSASSSCSMRIPAKLNSHSGQREHPDP